MNWTQSEHGGKPELCWTAYPTPNVRVSLEHGPGRHLCEVSIWVKVRCSDYREGGDVRPHRQWVMVADDVFLAPPDPTREAEVVYREWLRACGAGGL